MSETGNSFEVMFAKRRWKKPLRRVENWQENNLKVDPREVGCEGSVSRQGPMASVESLDSAKERNFVTS
jgi:hypothetical protein